jgi:hypothetical protein
MWSKVDQVFLQHPRENNMTYWQHACRSWCLAFTFACLTGKALVHGLVPCFWQTSSKDAIFTNLPKLYDETEIQYAQPTETASTTIQPV